MTNSPNTPAMTEQHPFFPSGEWEGFYKDRHGRHPTGEMTMTLDFANGHVTGAGTDPIGPYPWTGTYDTEAETCTLKKNYPGAHSVDYSGYADENGIWGKWSIKIWRSGDFHIWPKKAGASDADENTNAAANVAVRMKEDALTTTLKTVHTGLTWS
jgi:hypothetical protein